MIIHGKFGATSYAAAKVAAGISLLEVDSRNHGCGCSTDQPDDLQAVHSVAAGKNAVSGSIARCQHYTGPSHPSMGIMADNKAREQQARADQARTYEIIGTYEYLGFCKITAYCCEPYEHICGTGDGLTATGIPVSPGIVAVDPDVIPLGSTVVIDGQNYLAADTGGMVKGLHVDVAVATHVEAEDFGVQVAEVWVIPQEK